MKKILRIKLKAFRDNIGISEREDAEIKINNILLDFLLSNDFKNIAGYYPIFSEVNILPTLQNDTCSTLLPALNGDILEFRKWDKVETPHSNGLFPELSNKNNSITPDIILLPTLGYDEYGARLGYGGGYYDRTIPNYPNAKLAIVAFSKQKLLEIPLETHDIKANYIITESGIITCKAMKN